MLDLSRMFGSFSGLRTQIPQLVQAPIQQQASDPLNIRQRKLQRLSDRLRNSPFAKRGGQNVTQDLDPVQEPTQPMQPYDMMDDPFVSEGWSGPTTTYNPMNLGAMLGRRNFF